MLKWISEELYKIKLMAYTWPIDISIGNLLLVGLFLFYFYWLYRVVKSKREATERIKNYFKGSSDELEFIKSNGMYASANTFDLAIDQLYEIAKIDGRVIEAVKFSSAGSPSVFELKGIADQVTEGSGAWERLKGYVGEQFSADILSKQGYVVELADSPTQIGYDLLIDGEKYQVKTTLSTGYVKEHLDKYPDIPVIVPEELQGSVLSENDNVIFLSGFSHETANEMTTNGLEELNKIGDFTSSIPIPIITASVIGYEEYKKVKNNGKAVLEAVKDTVLETTGTAAGGAVGGAVGTIAGGTAMAAGIGSGVLGWGSATAVGGAIAAAGGKFGTIAGGAAFLVLGPLGAVAVGVGGAFGGAALGKHLVKKWIMRGVSDAENRVYSAIGLCAEELSKSLYSRRRALIRKKNLLNYNPLLFIFPTPEYLSNRALSRRYELDVENIDKAIIRVNMSMPECSDDKNVWASEILSIIKNTPVINKFLDHHAVSVQLEVEALNALLKKRGLLT